MRIILTFAYTLLVIAVLVLYMPVICLFVLWETLKAFCRACIESVKPFIYAIKEEHAFDEWNKRVDGAKTDKYNKNKKVEL